MAIIIGQGNTETLLPATTNSAATGPSLKLVSMNKTIQAILSGTATVVIEVSNDPLVETTPASATWVTLITTSVSGGWVNNEPWKYWRARVSAYTSGTIAVYAGM